MHSCDLETVRTLMWRLQCSSTLAARLHSLGQDLPEQCSWQAQLVTCSGTTERCFVIWRIAHTVADGVQKSSTTKRLAALQKGLELGSGWSLTIAYLEMPGGATFWEWPKQARAGGTAWNKMPVRCRLVRSPRPPPSADGQASVPAVLFLLSDRA